MTADTLWFSATATIVALALHGVYAPLFVALGIFGLGAVVLLAGMLIAKEE
jgi:hypothetical protein